MKFLLYMKLCVYEASAVMQSLYAGGAFDSWCIVDLDVTVLSDRQRFDHMC